MKAEVKKLVRDLEAVGYSVVKAKRSHWKVLSPTGGVVGSISSSPSDFRSLLNTRSDLRKRGVPV